MKSLNNHINEAWSGVKKQANKADIESWCDEMGIKNYTINSKGEIDVDGNVDLEWKNIIELPYKFGSVSGYFLLTGCKNLISLKNCPSYVGRFFKCNFCPQLNSLDGCPKKVDGNFYCMNCKRKFTEEEVRSLCIVRGGIHN